MIYHILRFCLVLLAMASGTIFGQITVNTNFTPNINQPLDIRQKIASLADTVSIGFVYPGALCYVTSKDSLYLRYSSGWKPIGSGTSLINWNSIIGIPAGFSDNIDNVGVITETDPTVGAHIKSISNSNINDWNNDLDSQNIFQYIDPGGNKGFVLENSNDTVLFNYITGSLFETDPTVPSHVKSITNADINNWNNDLIHDPDTLSVNGNNLSISGGNTVSLPTINEIDPTVLTSVKDGVSWTEVTSKPSGFADGIDNVGNAAGIDFFSDNNVYFTSQDYNMGCPDSTLIFEDHNFIPFFSNVGIRINPNKLTADIDTFRVVGNNIELSIKNDNKPRKIVAIPSGESTTVTDSPTIDLTLSGNNISGIVQDGSITPIKLSQSYLTSETDGSVTNELQVIDKFQLVANTLSLSLSADGEPDKIVSLASYLDNTDSQNLSGNYNQTSNILTINIAGGNSIQYNLSDLEDSITQEIVQDWIGTMVSLNNENNIVVTYNDLQNTFDFNIDLGAYLLISATDGWDKDLSDDLTSNSNFNGVIKGLYDDTKFNEGVVNGYALEDVIVSGIFNYVEVDENGRVTYGELQPIDNDNSNESITNVIYNNSNRILTISEPNATWTDTIRQTWSQIENIPAGFSDGIDNGITTETDPTVLASVKDGVSWVEVTGIPSGFSDGIDDTGILSEVDGSVTNELQNLFQVTQLSVVKGFVIEGTNDTVLFNTVTSTGFVEADPTVLASVKDGVGWGEVAGIPSGFSDNIDNTGLLTESDPRVPIPSMPTDEGKVLTVNNQGDAIWTTPSGGGGSSNFTYYNVSSGQSNSTTNDANITGSDFTLLANGVYILEAIVQYTCAATTTGVGVGVMTPAGVTCEGTVNHTLTTGMSSQSIKYNEQSNVSASSPSGGGYGIVYLFLRNDNSTNSTCSFKFRSEVSGSSVDIVLIRGKIQKLN